MKDLRDIGRFVIETEIKGLQSLTSCLDDTFAEIVNAILKIRGRVIVSGMGKSGHIARKISSTLSSTGTPSIYIHPAEAGHGDLGMITKQDIVLLLSNSGETSELSVIVNYCKRQMIEIIGISRKEKSALIEASTFKVVLPDIPEASDISAPTTSTTMMMVYGDAIAVALHKKRQFTISDYQILHPVGSLALKLLKLEDVMHTENEIPIISDSSTVLDAILMITSKRFGCVGVIDSRSVLIGIITDGDLRRHVVSVDISNTSVTSVMTTKPVVVTKDMLAFEALAIMNKRCITNLFIVNGEHKPIGIIHIHDLLKIC
ncbi:KpsF/GutQ family sugar-phosphate isomerase [Rickettsiales endosymbiont of Peranema trichophorum]|nr:KpsF/GutQ family sugar-phosphate isomerase [Rickettsiales endosymbiont of Peranema trichophorum]